MDIYGYIRMDIWMDILGWIYKKKEGVIGGLRPPSRTHTPQYSSHFS
jgi:hypothetical protein